MNNFFKLLFDADFEEKVNNQLDKALFENNISIAETISEIAEHYSQITSLIVSDYRRIIIDRTDFRQIKIDGKSYDLDNVISHSQTKFTEHLLAIDALFSDLIMQDANLEECIIEIEAMLNKKQYL